MTHPRGARDAIRGVIGADRTPGNRSRATEVGSSAMPIYAATQVRMVSTCSSSITTFGSASTDAQMRWYAAVILGGATVVWDRSQLSPAASALLEHVVP